MSHLAAHAPEGPVVYLPDGIIDPTSFQEKRRIVREGGPGAWFSLLADYLWRSLAVAQPDRVIVFHLTAPQVQAYLKSRPGVIEQLRGSGMTVGYRPLWGRGATDSAAALCPGCPRSFSPSTAR